MSWHRQNIIQQDIFTANQANTRIKRANEITKSRNWQTRHCSLTLTPSPRKLYLKCTACTVRLWWGHRQRAADNRLQWKRILQWQKETKKKTNHVSKIQMNWTAAIDCVHHEQSIKRFSTVLISRWSRHRRSFSHFRSTRHINRFAFCLSWHGKTVCIWKRFGNYANRFVAKLAKLFWQWPIPILVVSESKSSFNSNSIQQNDSESDECVLKCRRSSTITVFIALQFCFCFTKYDIPFVSLQAFKLMFEDANAFFVRFSVSRLLSNVCVHCENNRLTIKWLTEKQRTMAENDVSSDQMVK